MKETTKLARTEAKKLIEKYGLGNILNKHVTEVMERTGLGVVEMQNAMSYWKYRK